MVSFGGVFLSSSKDVNVVLLRKARAYRGRVPILAKVASSYLFSMANLNKNGSIHQKRSEHYPLYSRINSPVNNYRLSSDTATPVGLVSAQQPGGN